VTDVQLQLLGPVELVVGGRAVPLGGARQRALVALLALHRDRSLPTGTIVDQVWGSEAPRTVVKSMSTLLSRVRPLLEPHGIEILHAAAGYHLRAPVDTVDLHRFRDAVNRSRLAELNGDQAEAIRELHEALELWRGTPLVGLDGSFVGPAQAGLLLERESATARLATLLQQAGDSEGAIALLQRLAEQTPLREDRHAELMRALTAAGRSADAVAVYDELHDRLVDQIGLDPGELVEAARREAAGRVGSGALIGRAKELEFLEDGVRQALQREMSVVMVSGEPGAGKTKLVQAFVDRVAGRGFVTLIGCCEPTATIPLHPLMQVFEQVTERGLIDAADYPALRLLLAESAADPAGEVGDLRRRLLLNEVASIVLVVGAQGPLIVVLEDFHNADPMTLAGVEATAYDGIELPALLVLTARESELLRQGPSELALAEVATRGNLRHLELPPLTRDDIHELVARTAPAVAADPALLATVHEGAGGNPLYAELLARHLADHAGDPGPLPADIVELVRERLLSVPERGRELLEAASVLGQEFTLDEAGALLGDDQRVRQLRVWEARRSGVLEPVPGSGRHRFVHGIVQRVAYELPTAEHRAELHLAASRTRGHSSVGDLEVLHHLVNARPLVTDEEVADRILDAARRTIDHGAYGSAVRIVDQAAGLRLDPARQAEVRVLSGVARVSDGNAEAVPALDAAIAEAKAAERWDLAAEGLLARTRVGRFVTR
jgi:DNA-binding SARP family transcriptional activator